VSRSRESFAWPGHGLASFSANRRTVRHNEVVPDKLLNTEAVRVMLGLGSLQSAARALHRMGVRPVAREPGRSGMNLYDAEQIKAAIASRPGRRRKEAL
jgi:hypothetical protein